MARSSIVAQMQLKSLPSDVAIPISKPKLREKEKESQIDPEVQARRERHLKEKEDEKVQLKKQQYFEIIYLLKVKGTRIRVDKVKYFADLQKQAQNMDLRVADKSINKITDRVQNMVINGVLELQQQGNVRVVDEGINRSRQYNYEGEKSILQSQLRKLDLDISQLKQQRIDNPFSNYSQPAIQLYHKQELLKRQQDSSNFVVSLHQKYGQLHKTLEQKAKQENLRQQEIENKLRQENERQKEQYLKKKRLELRQHINQIKVRNRERLQNMIKVETKYYKNLDDKIQQLNNDRDHLQNLKIDKTTMISGVKQMKLDQNETKNKSTRNNTQTDINDKNPQIQSKDQTIKKTKKKIKKQKRYQIESVQIEKPLFDRMNDEFEKKLKNDYKQAKQELLERLRHDKNYQNIDVDKHQEIYRQRKLKLKMKYEQERQEHLNKMGMEDGKWSVKPSVPFESKLWMINENSKVSDGSGDINEKKQRHIKVKSYIDRVKSIDVPIDEEKQQEIQVRVNKLMNPKKYIKVLKRNRPGSVQQDDRDLFEQQIERGEQDRQYYNEGRKYLSELPELVQKIREDKQNNPDKYKQPMLDAVRKSMSAQVQHKKFDFAHHQNYIDQVTQQLKLTDGVEKRLKLNLSTPKQYKQFKLPPLTLKLQKEKQEIIEQIQQTDDDYIKQKLDREQKRKEHFLKINEVMNRLKQEKINGSQVLNKAEQADQLANYHQEKQLKLQHNAIRKWQNDPHQTMEEENIADDKLVDTIQYRLKALELTKKKKE